MQLNGNNTSSWQDTARTQPRHYKCHEALKTHREPHTEQRLSHYAHQPSPMLAKVGDELLHSLSNVVQQREKMSMRWIEIYARSVTQENFVPGEMVFVKTDNTMPSILEIFSEFSGANV